MTQFSMPWETQTGTGDGANSYDQVQANDFFREFCIIDPTSMGVVFGIGGDLAVSGIESPLSVATGRAIVYGFRYWNTAVLSKTITVPSVGDTGKRVVLQADWSANTVRTAVISSADGTATIPALTQTAATTWEISLASFVIDTVGRIWKTSAKTERGVTDLRNYALMPAAGSVPIYNYVTDGSEGSSLTLTNLPTSFSRLVLEISGRGFDTPFDLTVQVNGDTGANYTAVVMDDDSTLDGGSGQTYLYLARLTSTAQANRSFVQFQFLNYQVSDTQMPLALALLNNIGSEAGGPTSPYYFARGMTLNNSANGPITSITINFLYGNTVPEGMAIRLFGAK